MISDIIRFERNHMTETRKLGEILVAKGWVTQEQVDTALEYQHVDDRILGEILVEKGYISLENLYRGLAIQYEIAYVDFDEIKVSPQALKLIPKRLAYVHKFMPLFIHGEYFLIAISDPRDAWVEGEVQKEIQGFKIRSGIALPQHIQKALLQYYGPEGT